MKIIFGFSTKKKNIISKLIRNYSKADYSHCYVRINSPFTGNSIVYEASNFCVMALTFENFIKHNFIVTELELEIPEQSFKTSMMNIEHYLGSPFGLFTLLGIGLAQIFHLKNNPFSDKDKTLHCSEFLDIIIESFFKTTGKGELATPKDIENLLREYVSKSRA